MTDEEPDHTAFDELAAGHALDALDPADEERFLRHAEGCPRCRQTMAGFRQVAAVLAETAPPAEPSEQLGARILAAAADPGQQDRPAAGAAGAGTAGGTATPEDAPAPPVAPLKRRPGRHRPSRRWQQPAAAAAAAALIAGGGIWAGLAATAGGPPQPLAACARPHACAEVTLTAVATHRTAAKVVVQRGVAWMKPAKMAANPSDEIYVLWQITARQPPLPVGSFSIRPGATAAIRIGGLAAPYSVTRAFAVSLERGHTIPPRPSKPVAVGVIS